MMNARVPFVHGDDWLEGWMFGFVQSRLNLVPPLDVLDISLGDGDRPYRDTLEQRGARIEVAAPADLASNSVEQHIHRYDLVLVLSLERKGCLTPLDLENPLEFLDLLLNATKLLKPGGSLVWSYLYCFSTNPDDVHDFLEPAAVYQAIRRRNYRPMSDDYIGVDRITIYESSDTLFVRHKSLLELSDRYERVVRTIAGLTRPRGTSRVTYLPADQMLNFSDRETPTSA